MACQSLRLVRFRSDEAYKRLVTGEWWSYYERQREQVQCTECGNELARGSAMQVYLWHRHVQNTMVILEEIKLPHPLFPMCGILMPRWALNGTYRNTAQYKKGAEQNIWRLSVEEDREVTSRSFSAYRHPLDMVTSFKYLEQVISAVDND